MKKPTPRRRKAEDAPRAGYARAVSEMVPTIGGQAFRRFGFVQSSVVSRWKEIVGERYAEVTAPESIRFPAGAKSGGTLTLTVDGSHAPMIQHVLPSITERVNRFFGYPAVARVTIRQGSIRPAAKVAKPEPKPVPEELGDSLRAIADPELRACLEGLARGLAGSSGLPRIG
ncbi:DUF721 domain-containing protein [Sphingomonas sp. ID0503]|uniref:DUF721 domain-containing protein n=1 Tax=Sphingomonas sp. ID0503 TaxID=3399691 RepID=UPI003AFAFEE2